MTAVRIATIVEGQGEVTAVPVLLRRLAAEIDPEVWIDSPPPFPPRRCRGCAVWRRIYGGRTTSRRYGTARGG